MNKPIDRKYIFNMTLIFTTSMLLNMSIVSNAQIFKKRTKVEAEISFPADLNKERVSFDLKAEGIKKFSIILDKKSVEITKVKVFDTLGNLLFEDRIMPEDNGKKSYDLSHIQSQLFVVEVGNSKYNITKSIYAIPPGSKKSVDSQVNE